MKPLAAVIGITLTIGFSAVIGWRLARVTWIDGFNGVVAELLFGEDTKYAPGYSDSKWRLVQTGMAVG